jgi:hypothetical protein
MIEQNQSSTFTEQIKPPFNQEIITLYDPKYSVMFDQVPLNVIEELGKGISTVKQNQDPKLRINGELAGAIDDEFAFPESPLLHNYIKELFNTYCEKTNGDYIKGIKGLLSRSTIIQNKKIKISNEDVWVNFQKKHEYNPPHSHSGLLSWVIWYDIPYDIETERKNGPAYNPSDRKPHGQFSFFTPGSIGIGNNSTIEGWGLDVDYKWNGTIALFPSNLSHAVFPFYHSDKERITVAGNINLNL